MSLERASEIRAIAETAGILPADGTDLIYVGDARAVDTRVDAISCVSTSIAAHVLLLSVGDVVVGNVSIPAGAGSGAIPAVDLLASSNVVQRDGLVFPVGQWLGIQLEVALDAGEAIHVVAMGGTLQAGTGFS